MPNTGNLWNRKQLEDLKEAFGEKPPDVSVREFSVEYGRLIDRSLDSVRGQIGRLSLMGEINRGRIPESAYPVYDEPLVMEGDAVILPDLEAPFHHADFVNRVLDLADVWEIRQAILPGDAVHLGAFSGWQPNWKKENGGGITENAENKLVEFAKTLSPKKQGEMFGLLGDIGKADIEDGVSTELAEAGKVLRRLADQFDAVDWDLGNHEGRLLRTMETELGPKILFNLVALPDIQRPKWRIAPYYFSTLISAGEVFQIEHPKNTAKFSAWKLCAKYGRSVIMTHSHQLNFTFDVSGCFYAIEAGCCADETRFAYAAQRHNTAAQHALGAVIVRDGYPWLLHAKIDWERMRNM